MDFFFFVFDLFIYLLLLYIHVCLSEFFFFLSSASSKHCASPGAVCQTRRAERRKCLHVRQVSAIRLGWCGPSSLPLIPCSFYAETASPITYIRLRGFGWCIMTAFPLSAGAKRRCRRPNASRFTGRLTCWLSRWRGLPTSAEERLQRWTRPSRTT